MEASPEPITVSSGDRGHFAIEITFVHDDSPDVHGEDAVAWGDLVVWLKGRNVCAHELFGEVDNDHE